MTNPKQIQTKGTITTHQKTLYLTLTALFAALICVTTAYIFHIPFGANGGYIHVGDALIYLAGALLPTPYALAAAAIGGSMADLLTAPMWIPATFLIKMIITLPLTSKSDKIINKRNVIGVIVAGFLSFLGYYLADYILFGAFGALFASFLGSLAQSGGSAVIFILVGIALDKMGFKNRVNQFLER